MAQASVRLSASVDDAWPQLQLLSTWEGVAGIGDLNSAGYSQDGDLNSFRFAMETPVGRVRGSAVVSANKPVMTINADEKGLRITIRVRLRPDGDGDGDGDGDASVADVETTVKATSFLSKPLERTLDGVLNASINNEADKIARRVT